MLYSNETNKNVQEQYSFLLPCIEIISVNKIEQKKKKASISSYMSSIRLKKKMQFLLDSARPLQVKLEFYWTTVETGEDSFELSSLLLFCFVFLPSFVLTLLPQ